ncbi:unnamed protein product [Lactuca saligna]|uniref:Uncharacterized protein n=1 Tax=Lactuca saligna TaxID=75948 RepID=A0AA36E556_LACSI|nr:unnamed protein product [Lactuca saligna]
MSPVQSCSELQAGPHPCDSPNQIATTPIEIVQQSSGSSKTAPTIPITDVSIQASNAQNLVQAPVISHDTTPMNNGSHISPINSDYSLGSDCCVSENLVTAEIKKAMATGQKVGFKMDGCLEQVTRMVNREGIIKQ